MALSSNLHLSHLITIKCDEQWNSQTEGRETIDKRQSVLISVGRANLHIPFPMYSLSEFSFCLVFAIR